MINNNTTKISKVNTIELYKLTVTKLISIKDDLTKRDKINTIVNNLLINLNIKLSKPFDIANDTSRDNIFNGLKNIIDKA